MANGYKKIATGVRPGRLSMTSMSLWQGADHLLQLEKDGYSENYRRFYFADIEIFSMRIDKRQWTITFVLGSIVGIFLFISILTTGFARWFFLGFAAFFVIPMIFNWVRGPTCVVHLATAVQREELPSVRRVKSAVRLLQAIRDIAAQTQGLMAPDLVRVNYGLQHGPKLAAPPPLPSTGSPPGLPPLE